jgi:predicted NAD/FAD-binding protein
MVSASRFALIDDTVLDEEDPETRDLEQALRWTRTYAQLLTFAVRLQADQPSAVESLRRQAEMYSRRLQLWKDRCQAIADRYP